MTQLWHIRLLGELRLTQGERTITRFRTQKTGALLAYLAYHSQHSHAREVLVEHFWPETTPESGRHNLSHALSSLRSLLEPPGTPSGTVLVADRFTVGLNPDTIQVDVALFDAALRRAAQQRTQPEYASLLGAAIDLYTGDLLPGYYDDWVLPQQQRLQQRYEQALQERTVLAEKTGVWLPTRKEVVAPAPHGPPTGTVTVLLTDIEGSTALFESVGEDYRSALADHHRLLRHAFQQHGGLEIKEVGDAFVVVFSSVGDALAGALACQRALVGHTWPEAVGPLKVRMALHTGDIEWEGGEYRGLLLHRASRMLSAAHGGQLLCSEATARLLARDLAPELRLRDLGLWRLRDLPEPERLFQVEAGSPQDFPALRATAAQSAHLPLQFTRFFGREAEMEQLGRLLREGTRLLTLTGPGGTGKTRLSIEGVGRWSSTFSGSVWFVPLADLSDPSLICGAILQAMGVPLSGNGDPLEQVLGALSRQTSVLILDNFEQLVVGGAELVQEILSRVASVQVVVTSRQILSLPGEVVFPVSALSTPNGASAMDGLSLFESVQLFVDRAQSVKPDFRITLGNAAALAELCDRLEGIPLGIELAAARALVLSPSQMLAQLGNRFEFLVSRKRGVVERQRTLRATIDWSFRLLAPELQCFFAQLGVFRGGWSLEAAEAVCDEPLALDLLAQLQECSLVTTYESAGQIRFSMLETLREYALEQHNPEARRRLQQRHAAFYVEYGNDRHRFPQAEWLDRLELEQDNVREALRWACSPEGEPRLGFQIVTRYGYFWVVRAHIPEGRRWLDTLLERGLEGIDPELKAHVFLNSGQMAWHEGKHTLGQEHLETSLAIFREAGKLTEVTYALSLLAANAFDGGDPDKSKVFREECLTIQEQLGDRRGIAMSRFSLAQFNDDRAAREQIQRECVALFREIGDTRSLALALINLGNDAAEQGHLDAAKDYYEESLASFQQIKDQRGTGSALGGVGTTLAALGEFSAARVVLQESIALYGEIRIYRTNTIGAVEVFGPTLAHFDPLMAARLWGAMERQREEAGLPPRASSDPTYEGHVAAVREALGDVAFDQAWQEGRTLSLEQAVEEATRWTEPQQEE